MSLIVVVVERMSADGPAVTHSRKQHRGTILPAPGKPPRRELMATTPPAPAPRPRYPGAPAPAQGVSAFLQSPLQSTNRPAELFRGFVAAQAGQIAQQERQTQSLRQMLQFLIEGGSHFTPNEIGFRRSRGTRLRRILDGNDSSLSCRAAMRQVVV